jgi:phosphoribosylaminoimidazole-succinocarboxamide synthase
MGNEVAPFDTCRLWNAGKVSVPRTISKQLFCNSNGDGQLATTNGESPVTNPQHATVARFDTCGLWDAGTVSAQSISSKQSCYNEAGQLVEATRESAVTRAKAEYARVAAMALQTTPSAS